MEERLEEMARYLYPGLYIGSTAYWMTRTTMPLAESATADRTSRFLTYCYGADTVANRWPATLHDVYEDAPWRSRTQFYDKDGTTTISMRVPENAATVNVLTVTGFCGTPAYYNDEALVGLEDAQAGLFPPDRQ